MEKESDSDKWTERVYIAWQYFGVVLIAWFFYTLKYRGYEGATSLLILICLICICYLYYGFFIIKE